MQVDIWYPFCTVWQRIAYISYHGLTERSSPYRIVR